MKDLFDETQINGMELKNRFIKAATWENMADEKGHLTEQLTSVYDEVSKGGVGLIITGYAFVTEDEQPNPGMMGIYEDSFIDEYRELTDMVHNNGSKIVMQIVYGGTKTTFKTEDRVILGPSAVKNSKTGVMAKKMTKEDINDLVKAYGKAAERCKKAGFDGVQIHAAHTYLLNQFLSPYHNRRTDEYGGTIENRARILFEIHNEIRDRVGEDYPVLLKVTAGDFEEGGQSFAESLDVCKAMAKKGIDAIEVSGNIHSTAQEYFGEDWYGYTVKEGAFFKDYATKVAAEVNVPIILVGGLREFEVIENLLQETEIEYFSMCRPLMAEPNLINRWQEGDRSKSKCKSCGECYTEEGNICILNR
ncbi:NADH:flavin oxidoreductase [Fuchsiella alkaliacetigena]|uniref:NADH:flavin oxidoreductase n=1 Tax=Fuchsiella alkaliacetigena TaxID=957042 RepID=UPI00200BA083|nr:NADH:flavin oxidoreductase [Fuchsiella alkaliacetigena]MCK8823830.1 NADH:flavin oxidoreductase [Fuchsiella alkaliacetigena]